MLNQEYIRNQLLLIAQPGMWTEQAVRNVCAEAERHAKDCVQKAVQGTLYEGSAPQDGRTTLAAADLRDALKVIQMRKEILRFRGQAAAMYAGVR